jgi:hypothetical protein
MQTDRVNVVFDFLAVIVGQPREASHAHAHGQMPFDILRSKFKLARKFLIISFLLLDLVAMLNSPVGRRVIPFREYDCVVAAD